MRRLPKIKHQNRILIICEGSEESDYLSRLKSLSVWDNSISVELKNAKSIENIESLYEYNYQSGNYKIVLIFCDTEQEPYGQYSSLIKKIKAFHGKKSSECVVFFANPCTMQIVLSHFGRVTLTSNSKSVNAGLIEKLTGVEDYKATEKQRLSIMNKITAENYATMKENIAALDTRYTSVPSTNCLFLFNGLERDAEKWIRCMSKKVDN